MYHCITKQSSDEWVPGEVLRRTETEIPNTKVTIKSFDVSYTVRAPDTDKDQTINERRVKSDRIRLLANVDGDVTTAEPEMAALPRGPIINENTGTSYGLLVIDTECF